MKHQFCMIIIHDNIKYSGKANTDTYSEIIQLIIKDYMIFKDYIPNSVCFKNFLNVKRCSNWPEWEIGHDYSNCEDRCFSNISIMNNIIFINNIIESKVINSKIRITNQKVITPEFIEFINRRFLLKHICNKYKVPKDIHQHLMGFF